MPCQWCFLVFFRQFVIQFVTSSIYHKPNTNWITSLISSLHLHSFQFSMLFTSANVQQKQTKYADFKPKYESIGFTIPFLEQWTINCKGFVQKLGYPENIAIIFAMKIRFLEVAHLFLGRGAACGRRSSLLSTYWNMPVMKLALGSRDFWGGPSCIVFGWP